MNRLDPTVDTTHNVVWGSDLNRAATALKRLRTLPRGRAALVVSNGAKRAEFSLAGPSRDGFDADTYNSRQRSLEAAAYASLAPDSLALSTESALWETPSDGTFWNDSPWRRRTEHR